MSSLTNVEGKIVSQVPSSQGVQSFYIMIAVINIVAPFSERLPRVCGWGFGVQSDSVASLVNKSFN